MSLAIFRAMLLGLLRDRGALLMSFFLPAVFFVIMAEIFTATTGDSLNLKVTVLDEVESETSQRLLSALQDNATLTLLPELATEFAAVCSKRRANGGRREGLVAPLGLSRISGLIRLPI